MRLPNGRSIMIKRFGGFGCKMADPFMIKRFGGFGCQMADPLWLKGSVDLVAKWQIHYD